MEGDTVTDLPVACTLTDKDLRERRGDVLNLIRAHVKELKPLATGYALRLEPEEAPLHAVSTFINLERRCCAFLTFTLTVSQDRGPVWLELTGPEGTKPFLASLLNL